MISRIYLDSLYARLAKLRAHHQKIVEARKPAQLKPCEACDREYGYTHDDEVKAQQDVQEASAVITLYLEQHDQI